MIKGIAIAMIVVNILIFVLFPLLLYKVSYDDFSTVKSSYQNESAIRAVSPSESKYLVLFFIGTVIVAMVICYFIGLPIGWSLMLFAAPVHIALIEHLVKVANTNFFWYKLFSNPWFGFLFGIIKSEKGLVIGMGSWPYISMAPGFIYLYILVTFLVWAFLRKE